MGLRGQNKYSTTHGPELNKSQAFGPSVFAGFPPSARSQAMAECTQASSFRRAGALLICGLNIDPKTLVIRTPKRSP